MVNGLLVQRLGWMRKNMYRSESFFYKLGPFSYTLVSKNKLKIYNDLMIGTSHLEKSVNFREWNLVNWGQTGGI